MRRSNSSQSLFEQSASGLKKRSKPKRKSVWRKRFLALRENEKPYVESAAGFLAGVDEAGRGPLAGPVVVAAVILPIDFRTERIDDSKKLNHVERKKLYDEIWSAAISVSWVSLSERVIDGAGILNATYIGMREAVSALSVAPSLVLVDGRKVPRLNARQLAFDRADGTFISVAAASVVAKHVRDNLMQAAHEEFPQYGFNIHKGYSTKLHIESLLRYGPCRLHRFSFRPVKEIEFMRRSSGPEPGPG